MIILENYDQKESLKQTQRQKMMTQNISELKTQITQKQEMALKSKNHMNRNEAEINNNSTVPMDFIMPSDTIICGIPGIGISHDRKK